MVNKIAYKLLCKYNAIVSTVVPAREIYILLL